MQLRTTTHGFAVTGCRELPELDGRMWRLEHVQSSARLVWLDRADPNMTFAVAFPTPPEDDTGMFHILEHSVLCGSKRYPVKDPFVELMKGSMNTFLNAMTLPDRTIYPVSSRNQKDFANLMRVYMDGLLHPLIYDREEIFRQEGWRYAFDNKGSPLYTGVVLNEMRGALASPEALLEREMLRRLFPDTCLRHNASGDPRHIPELTYERFLDCHRRYYHPSNAYLFLDGRLEIEKILGILDGEFLSGYFCRETPPLGPEQPPVQPPPARIRFEASPGEQERGSLAWGYVLGDFRDREERIAVQALADVLCGSNQAPVARRVLASGLAQDAVLSVVDGLRQPFALLELRGLDENRAGEADGLLREELERLVGGGLDHAQLYASLANLEFQMRERDYGGMPRGVAFAMDVMSSWIYGGDPAANLEIGPLFANLDRKLEEGWFEDLLDRRFLHSGHCAQVMLLPSDSLGQEKMEEEAARLQEARDGWSAERGALLRDQAERLTRWQATGDDPRALAAIPKLTLADLAPKPEELPTELKSLGGVPLLRHCLPTGGICYVDLYFDISDLSEEELFLASLLSTLLGELDTRRFDTLSLQRLCRLNTGSIQFGIETYSRTNTPEDCRTYFCASFSALERKLGEAAGLTAGFLLETGFESAGMMEELLRQELLQMEQSIAANGSHYAMGRISAGYSVEGAVRECVAGIRYFHWLKGVERDFDARFQRLQTELFALCRRIFTSGRLTIGFTGGSGGALHALEEKLLALLPSSDRRERACTVKPWGRRREGIVIPTDTSFAVLGGSLLRCGAPYSGTAEVMSGVLSLVHLWNEVRVQGGAYGTAVRQGPAGNACFHSYRDPDPARSLGCFRRSADFLREFCAAKPDLTGFIIGEISASTPLLLPRQQGKMADSFYLRGVTYEERCRTWHEMLSASSEALSALAAPLQELQETGSVCVVSPLQQLETCGADIESLVTL